MELYGEKVDVAYNTLREYLKEDTKIEIIVLESNNNKIKIDRNKKLKDLLYLIEINNDKLKDSEIESLVIAMTPPTSSSNFIIDEIDIDKMEEIKKERIKIREELRQIEKERQYKSFIIRFNIEDISKEKKFKTLLELEKNELYSLFYNLYSEKEYSFYCEYISEEEFNNFYLENKIDKIKKGNIPFLILSTYFFKKNFFDNHLPKKESSIQLEEILSLIVEKSLIQDSQKEFFLSYIQDSIYSANLHNLPVNEFKREIMYNFYNLIFYGFKKENLKNYFDILTLLNKPLEEIKDSDIERFIKIIKDKKFEEEGFSLINTKEKKQYLDNFIGDIKDKSLKGKIEVLLKEEEYKAFEKNTYLYLENLIELFIRKRNITLVSICSKIIDWSKINDKEELTKEIVEVLNERYKIKDFYKDSSGDIQISNYIKIINNYAKNINSKKSFSNKSMKDLIHENLIYEEKLFQIPLGLTNYNENLLKFCFTNLTRMTLYYRMMFLEYSSESIKKLEFSKNDSNKNNLYSILKGERNYNNFKELIKVLPSENIEMSRINFLLNNTYRGYLKNKYEVFNKDEYDDINILVETNLLLNFILKKEQYFNDEKIIDFEYYSEKVKFKRLKKEKFYIIYFKENFYFGKYSEYVEGRDNEQIERLIFYVNEERKIYNIDEIEIYEIKSVYF